MSDQPERRATLVMSFDGSSASDNGESIKVGVRAMGEAPSDMITPVDRAVDLMTLIGAALGEAKWRKTADPSVRYVYPLQG